MGKKSEQSPAGIRIIAKNKRAYFDYFIESKYEAGIVLLGSEVKSIRAGHVSMGEAFARFAPGTGELYLENAHVAEYAWANRNNHEPRRLRKLLLHKKELAKLSQVLDRQGLTLIPLSMYFKRGRVKIELGLGRGKKSYDKRESIKAKTAKQEMTDG